jgi:ketosteroid isomerase-like protein
MTRFFLRMGEVWESFEMVEQEFLATGETAVVLTQVRARARATGRELSFPVLQTITVKDGRITEVRPFYWDTRAIADACAVPTPTPAPAPAD